MIRGIHYFSTNLKTKIDVIPRRCFNVSSFIMVFGHQLDILNIGSFILRGEVWIRIQFQASLLMKSISQDSVSCIDGKHDNKRTW